MNIGIYLGTFNPPHIGHLNCLYSALNTKLVDRILVVPAFHNPWKKKGLKFDPNNHDGMSLDQEFFFRHNMCQAMFKDLIDKGKVRVSDIEYHIWRKSHRYDEDVVYSHETLSKIKNIMYDDTYDLGWGDIDNIDPEDLHDGKKESPKFVIVTTIETLVTIPDWKEGKWILANFPIIAMSCQHMSSSDIDPNKEEILKRASIFGGVDLPIHSTMIRERWLNGQHIMPFVNKEVCKLLVDEANNVAKLWRDIK